jgi:hypothetical protein
MVETVTRKRIEILVDTPLVPRLIKHARDDGASFMSTPGVAVMANGPMTMLPALPPRRSCS